MDLKGHFLSRLKLIGISYLSISHLSVVQKNRYKFDLPGGREGGSKPHSPRRGRGVWPGYEGLG